MIELIRTTETDKQTLGQFYIDKEFVCFTLELSWHNNEHNISHIPEGIYNVKKRYSNKHKNHFHILDVKDRSYILIHAGNFYTDIRGCIIVGDGYKDINKDNYLDVINSKKTLKNLLKLLPDEFELKIIDHFDYDSI
jgi:hypothetical protein